MLDRFEQLVAFAVEDDFGTAHAQFEVFTAHGLDEDGHLELATSLDDEAVLLFGFVHAYGHIAQRLLHETVANLA